MVKSRIAKLTSRFSDLGVDAFIVTDNTNVTYLTGFASEDAWLLVSRQGAQYVTDGRYTLAAGKGLKHTGIQVVTLTASLLDEVGQQARKLGLRKVGVDAHHLSMAQGSRMRALFRGKFKLVACDHVVDTIRMVKDSEEIRLIKAALRINLEAYSHLRRRLRPGVRESKLLTDLEVFAKNRQVGFSFPPIIASGPNSAMPHARVTERQLRQNEPVLIDCGIDLKGYKSDLTRMFFLGRMPTTFREILKKVEEAQHSAFQVIRAGETAANVDFAARNCLKKHNLDGFFTHSLGHGVGLDIHEMPRVSGKSGVKLAENMVFTVEPGVYFPNRFGIRLEEMVRVTKTGCEVLSVNLD